jgi:hypothetical protein
MKLSISIISLCLDFTAANLSFIFQPDETNRIFVAKNGIPVGKIPLGGVNPRPGPVPSAVQI